MKNLKSTLRLAVIAFVFVFASCSKDDSPAEDTSMDEPTTQELLMTGKWYMQSTSIGGPLNECERQTYLQFVDEDTLVIQSFSENGAMECESSGIRVQAYLMSGEDQFLLDNESDHPYDVDFVSATQLVLSQTAGAESYTIHFLK